MTLPKNLEILREQIEGYAREYGLDFFETIFEMLDFEQINEVASYSGFPTRYPHWKFGMEYDRMSKGYSYGLQKIYEMVINNDPCYAYLLNSNHIVDQKIVIGHVYAHCDFFKNNYWFSCTNRKMMDEMANHSTRVKQYIEQFGEEAVEMFLDTCLSVENLIDIHRPFIKREEEKKRTPEEAKDARDRLAKYRLKSKMYMDHYINPQEIMEKMDADERKEQEEDEKTRKFPEKPEQDVLLFLLHYAPLTNWQADILSIIREESYYFAPQGQTKILNEGWASFWHSKIMTERAADASEIVDFADHHSGTVAMSPGRINPYKIGLELFRDIEERWNKGRFGKEYDECDNYVEKKNWNKELWQGRNKIFQVRKIYNDVMFIDEFLTEEFCKDHKMFAYRYNKNTGMYEIDSRDFQKIKNMLLFSLTNFGQPFIFVQDGNYGNKGELYLLHRHEGIDLKMDWAKETLKHLHTIWKRPINLETVSESRKKLLRFDGEEHSDKNL